MQNSRKSNLAKDEVDECSFITDSDIEENSTLFSGSEGNDFTNFILDRPSKATNQWVSINLENWLIMLGYEICNRHKNC